MLSQSQIETIKRRHSLESVVSQHTQLRSVSGELKGPCPLDCAGGDDRFVIFGDGDRYWCRRCEATGDIFDYLKAKLGLRFVDAIEYLEGSGESSRPIPILKPKATPAPDIFDSISQQERQSLIDNWVEELDSGEGETAAIFNPAESLIPLTPLQYLYAMRMLEPRTVEKYRLGFNNESFEYCDRRVPVGITIPLTEGKKIVGFKIRTPEGKPKYWRLGKGTYCQNQMSLREHRTVLVAEGEFDQMLLDQTFGDRFATVTFGGTSDISKAELSVLFFNSERVYWAFDGDAAGANAAAKYDRKNPRYRKLLLPDGEDVTSFYLKTGEKKFTEYFETRMQEVAD